MSRDEGMGGDFINILSYLTVPHVNSLCLPSQFSSGEEAKLMAGSGSRVICSESPLMTSIELTFQV